MPQKTTTTTTSSTQVVTEKVEKTHSEKVSDGMKKYWQDKKLAEKDAEIESLQKKLDKANQKIKAMKSEK